MSGRDEFYIGYEPGMPAGVRRATVAAVVAAMVCALGAAVVLVSQERRLADSTFEFGVTRTFNGYLELSPVPVLIGGGSDRPQRFFLVAPGKFGAAAVLGGAQPGWVTLSGTLIEREQWRMIEVAPGSLRLRTWQIPPPTTGTSAGARVALTGEIVDSKCYLGVMNPGERTVHRDCAVRCLAGGVPAMFAYRDDTGSHLALLLGADAHTLANGVGQSITLRGTLSGSDSARVFSLVGEE